MIRKTLTIAGSDSSGGAGLQADLKTFEEFGVFGFCAITSIVTMDPENNWSHSVSPLDETLFEKQLDTIFSTSIDAVKTGMLGSVAMIKQTQQKLLNKKIPFIVIDPVIACKGTNELLQPENVDALKTYLLPLATITTPNLVEAGILSGIGELTSVEDMKEAAKIIYALGPKHVVVKGGRRLKTKNAVDVFYDGETFTLLESPQIETAYNHGAGCTFAAAITAGLAKGLDPKEAVLLAKEFVFAAIENGVKINPYLGHVWHGAYSKAEHRILPNKLRRTNYEAADNN